jgi:hypothetical protein
MLNPCCILHVHILLFLHLLLLLLLKQAQLLLLLFLCSRCCRTYILLLLSLVEQLCAVRWAANHSTCTWLSSASLVTRSCNAIRGIINSCSRLQRCCCRVSAVNVRAGGRKGVSASTGLTAALCRCWLCCSHQHLKCVNVGVATCRAGNCH